MSAAAMRECRADHPGARQHQVMRQGAVAGADVEDELAGTDPRGLDDPRGPVVTEPVPAPASP
jgi:hypothetical protein